jgi:hypothetical protein
VLPFFHPKLNAFSASSEEVVACSRRTSNFCTEGSDSPNGATTRQDPEINQATLDAVATYFPAHTGEHYSPHVTIGVGTVDYLNALLAAPFPTFTFSPVGLSVYQFGNYGTAMKQLHSFKLTQ